MLFLYRCRICEKVALEVFQVTQNQFKRESMNLSGFHSAQKAPVGLTNCSRTRKSCKNNAPFDCLTILNCFKPLFSLFENFKVECLPQINLESGRKEAFEVFQVTQNRFKRDSMNPSRFHSAQKAPIGVINFFLSRSKVFQVTHDNF